MKTHKAVFLCLMKCTAVFNEHEHIWFQRGEWGGFLKLYKRKVYNAKSQVSLAEYASPYINKFIGSTSSLNVHFQNYRQVVLEMLMTMNFLLGSSQDTCLWFNKNDMIYSGTARSPGVHSISTSNNGCSIAVGLISGSVVTERITLTLTIYVIRSVTIVTSHFVLHLLCCMYAGHVLSKWWPDEA